VDAVGGCWVAEEGRGREHGGGREEVVRLVPDHVAHAGPAAIGGDAAWGVGSGDGNGGEEEVAAVGGEERSETRRDAEAGGSRHVPLALR
jgi:hypothetical protein